MRVLDPDHPRGFPAEEVGDVSQEYDPKKDRAQSIKNFFVPFYGLSLI